MGAFPKLQGGVAEGCPGGSGLAGRCRGSAGAEPGKGASGTGWPKPLRAPIRSWGWWLLNANQKSFQKPLIYGSSNQAGIKHQKAVLCLSFQASTLPKKFFCWTFSPKHIFTAPPVASLRLFVSSFAGCMPVTPTSTCPSFHLHGRLQTILPTVKFWAMDFFQLCRSKKGP